MSCGRTQEAQRRLAGEIDARLRSADATDVAEQVPWDGRVEDARSGRGVSGAHVHYEESGLEAQSVLTDSKGSFEIPNAGTGILTVTARGYASQKRSWPPRRGRTLTFHMTAPSILDGRVSISSPYRPPTPARNGPASCLRCGEQCGPSSW